MFKIEKENDRKIFQSFENALFLAKIISPHGKVSYLI